MGSESRWWTTWVKPSLRVFSSPSELCCWSTAGSPRRRRTSSQSVSSVYAFPWRFPYGKLCSVKGNVLLFSSCFPLSFSGNGGVSAPQPFSSSAAWWHSGMAVPRPEDSAISLLADTLGVICPAACGERSSNNRQTTA